MRHDHLRVAAVAVVGGLLLGVVDFLWIKFMPSVVAHLGNSSAVWAVAAFWFGYWARSGWLRAGVGAAVGLVVAVPGYYLTATLVQDDDLAVIVQSTSLVWMGFGVLAGLIFGIAGAWARAGSGREGAAGWQGAADQQGAAGLGSVAGWQGAADQQGAAGLGSVAGWQGAADQRSAAGRGGVADQQTAAERGGAVDQRTAAGWGGLAGRSGDPGPLAVGGEPGAAGNPGVVGRLGVFGAAMPGAVMFAEGALLSERIGDPSYGSEPLPEVVLHIVIGALVVALAVRGWGQRLLALGAALPLAVIGFFAFHLGGFR